MRFSQISKTLYLKIQIRIVFLFNSCDYLDDINSVTLVSDYSKTNKNFLSKVSNILAEITYIKDKDHLIIKIKHDFNSELFFILSLSNNTGNGPDTFDNGLEILELMYIYILLERERNQNIVIFIPHKLFSKILDLVYVTEEKLSALILNGKSIF